MIKKFLKYILRQSTEIAILLFVVSLFFGLLTTLLFALFPSGISLTQILEQRESAKRGRAGAGRDDSQALAVLTQMQNEVKSKGANSIAWSPAQEGMKLRDHDAVQTFNASSAQINFDARNYLIVGSNSLVIIKRMQQESTRNERRTAIVVLDGELRARIASSGPNPLQLDIATPTAVIKMGAGSTDTEKADLRISVKADKSTIVVVHGEADISAQGKTVHISASENKAVTVKQGEAPKPAPLPAPPPPPPPPSPPAQVSPADRTVIRYRDLPQRVNLTWSGEKSANNYHLQVAKDHAFKEIVVDKRLPEAQFSHGNLKKGVYFWRVSRIEGGVEGPMSKGMRFEVTENFTPPSLQVDFPNAPVMEEYCIVTGSTEPGNKVYVGGKPVPTDARGAFTCEVKLKTGMTLVTVEAVDASGNVTYKSRYIQGRFEP